MTPFVREWIAGVVREFGFENRRILEIGSLDVNGTVRDLFPMARSYLGIDRVLGPGVDKQMDAHFVPHSWRGDFDDVLCLETLEHDVAFWLTVSSVRELLPSGGRFVLSVPSFDFPSHHPPDYWRFSEEGVRVLLHRFDVRRLDVFSGGYGAVGVW